MFTVFTVRWSCKPLTHTLPRRSGPQTGGRAHEPGKRGATRLCPKAYCSKLQYVCAQMPRGAPTSRPIATQRQLRAAIQTSCTSETDEGWVVH
eukprot:1138750-Pelagomonas_calceolata.AAC.1